MRIKNGKYDIILKPAAVVIIAMILAYMARSLIFSGATALVSAFSARKAVSDPLENGGFEPPYQPRRLTGPHQVAQVTGNLSTHWEDRSRWNDVAVDYEETENNPHSGKTCQKIIVKEIRNGTVKYCQGIRTEPGQTYEASVWLRASAPTTVTVGVRRLRATAYILSTDAQVTTEWKKVSVHVPVQEDPLVYLMMEIKEPVTLFVDDATFRPSTEP